MFKGGKKNFRNILQNKKLKKTNHQEIKFQSFVKVHKIGGTGSRNRNHSFEECSIGKQMNMISGTENIGCPNFLTPIKFKT